MKAVVMAALAAQVLVTGGAGVEERPEAERAAPGWREVGQRFRALRREISQVERDLASARERHRVAAEREEREREQPPPAGR